MAYEIPLDAEAVLRGTRAQVDQWRKQFYIATKWSRNDELLPKVVPPGWQITRQRDDGGAPADDGAWKPGPIVRAERTAWVRQDGSPAVGRILAAPGRGDIDGSGMSVSRRLVVEEREDQSKRVYGDAAWYGTPFGQEPAVFIPAAVLGANGWEPPVLTSLPADAPQLVAVRDPHPYLRDLPPPVGFVIYGSASGGVAERRYALYPSRVIVTGRGDRQEPWFYDFATLGGRPASIPAGYRGFWMGHYEDEERGQWWDDAVGEIQALAARGAAVKILVFAAAAVATAATGGAAAPLAESFVATAGTAAASAAGSTAAPAVLAEARAAYAAAPPEVRLAAEAAPTVAPVVAPEQTNRFLAEAAQASLYVDALGSVEELYAMGFRELTIRAQRTRDERDRLRLRIAAKQQELGQTEWFRIAKASIAGAKQAVLLIATAGTANAAIAAMQASMEFAAAQLLVSASKLALGLVNARETVAALERAMADEEAEAIAALNQEIAMLEAGLMGTSGGAANPIAAPRETWYAPLVRYAEGWG